MYLVCAESENTIIRRHTQPTTVTIEPLLLFTASRKNCSPAKHSFNLQFINAHNPFIAAHWPQNVENKSCRGNKVGMKTWSRKEQGLRRKCLDIAFTNYGMCLFPFFPFCWFRPTTLDVWSGHGPNFQHTSQRCQCEAIAKLADT